MATMKKPHVVCIPLPAQGHINPMFKLAKLLHSRHFYITFVHTEFNYKKLVNSKPAGDPDSLVGVEDFRFETVSDGLPASNPRGILDLPDLCVSMPTKCRDSFRELIERLNSSAAVPPVTSIVSDGVMSFTMEVAKEFGIPEIFLFTPSACGMLGYLHFGQLIERGYFPLKDANCLSNGYLDTVIDWIPTMEGIRLKDLPTFLRTTNRDDIMFNYNLESVNNALKTGSLILNTFDDLEQQVLDAIKIKFPTLYTIGPLSMLSEQICDQKLSSIGSNLWEEDTKCLEWLANKELGSVIYVNFGSLVIMSPNQLFEFAWGLANSKHPFMWVIRANLVNGGVEVISRDFLEEIRDRGLILDWCPQEKVLQHASIGGFLTHCGWNSTLESISGGVPMICWPFFAEQQTNCFYLCNKWGVGMEIDSDVKRGEVEGMVRGLMEGNKGKEMREKALKWRKKAEGATRVGGSSHGNFNLLVKHLKGECKSASP